jgi:hypothetical protein
MKLTLNRVRGSLLRLALYRRGAVFIGSTFAAFSLSLLAFDYTWESWLSDGISLVVGATGVALLLTGVQGRRQDWIDPATRSSE